MSQQSFTQLSVKGSALLQGQPGLPDRRSNTDGPDGVQGLTLAGLPERGDYTRGTFSSAEIRQCLEGDKDSRLACPLELRRLLKDLDLGARENPLRSLQRAVIWRESARVDFERIDQAIKSGEFNSSTFAAFKLICSEVAGTYLELLRHHSSKIAMGAIHGLAFRGLLVKDPAEYEKLVEKARENEEVWREYAHVFENSLFDPQPVYEILLERLHQTTRTQAAFELLEVEYDKTHCCEIADSIIQLVAQSEVQPSDDILKRYEGKGDYLFADLLKGSVKLPEGMGYGDRADAGNEEDSICSFPYRSLRELAVEASTDLLESDPASIKQVVSSLLLSEDLQNLELIRDELGESFVDYINPRVAERSLQRISAEPEFGSSNSLNSLQRFDCLLEVTGVTPRLDENVQTLFEEKYLLGRLEDRDSRFEQIEKLLGIPAELTDSDLDLYCFKRLGMASSEQAVSGHLTKAELEEILHENLKRVGDTLSPTTFIKLAEGISRGAPERPDLNGELFKQVLKRVSEVKVPNLLQQEHLRGLELVIWYELYTGQKPGADLLEVIRPPLYSHRFPPQYVEKSDVWQALILSYGHNAIDTFALSNLPVHLNNDRDRLVAAIHGPQGPPVKDWLISYYGAFSTRELHGVLVEKLAREMTCQDILKSIEEIFGPGSPGFDLPVFHEQIRKNSFVTGREARRLGEASFEPEEFLQQKLYAACERAFIQNYATVKDVCEKLEDLWGIKFSPSPLRAQVCYLAVLGEPDPIFRRQSSDPRALEFIGKECDFIAERSGVLPAPEIIQLALMRKAARTEAGPGGLKAWESLLNAELEPAGVVNFYKKSMTEYLSGELDSLEALRNVEAITGVSGKESGLSLEQAVLSVNQRTKISSNRIQALSEFLGEELSPSFVERFALKERRISGFLMYKISDAQLDQHFAACRYDRDEYMRVYRQFSPRQYFENLIQKVEQADQTLPASTIQQAIVALAAMTAAEQDNKDYRALTQRLEKLFEQSPRSFVKDFAWAHRQLYRAGEYRLVRAHANRIAKFAGGPRRPLSKLEELSYRVLLKTDSWHGNDALLDCVFATQLPLVLRRHTLNYLAEMTNMFPNRLADQILDVFAEKASLKDMSRVGWEQIKYLREIHKLRNNEQMVRSRDLLIAGYDRLSEKGQQPSTVHREFSDIPGNIFIQLGHLLDWDKDLLEKFNRLYQSEQDSESRLELQFGIIHCSRNHSKWEPHLQRHLKALDYEKEGAFEEVSTLLNRTALAIIHYSITRDNVIYYQPLLRDLFLTEKLSSFKQGLDRLEDEVLTHAFAATDNSEEVLKTLRDHPLRQRALLTLLADRQGTIGDIANLLAPLVADYLLNGDEGFKAARYDQGVGSSMQYSLNLTEEEFAVWKEDHVTQIDSNQVSLDEEALNRLRPALREVFRAENPKPELLKAVSIIQELVNESVGAANGLKDGFNDPDIDLPEIYQRLSAERNVLAEVLRAIDARKVEDVLSAFLARSSVKLDSSSTKQILRQIEVFAVNVSELEQPSALRKQIIERGEMSCMPGELVTENVRKLILAEIEKSKEQTKWVSKQNLSSGLRAVLTTERIKTLSQYARAQGVAEDLIVLWSQAAVRQEMNLPLERPVLERLLRVTEGTGLGTFLSTVQRHSRLRMDRRLALFITDNPFMMMQIGKYPLSSGSCLNIDGSSKRKATLVSMASDPHIKGCFLIDIDRLPRKAGEEGESDLVGNSLLRQYGPEDLLKATLARSIIRLTANRGRPAIFKEPIYPLILQNDPVIHEAFGDFLESSLARPLGTELFEEGEEVMLYVPPSTCNSGQYEDCSPLNGRDFPMGIKKGAYNVSAGIWKKNMPEDKHSDNPAGNEKVLQTGDLAGEAYRVVAASGAQSKYRIENIKGLRVAIFSTNDDVSDILEATGDPELDYIEVDRPASAQVALLRKHGFDLTPPKIGYQLIIPGELQTAGQITEWYNDRGSHSRQRRGAHRKIMEELEKGGLSLAGLNDSSESAKLFPEFLTVYKRLLASRTSGTLPLVKKFRAEGSDPLGFFEKKRKGIFLLHEGSIIGGLILKELKDRYSVSYSATDPAQRVRYKNVQQFLLGQALLLSLEKKFDRLSYGVDNNLYGGNFPAGLALHKLGEGFTPYPIGTEARLIRLTDRAAASSSLLYFYFDSDRILKARRSGSFSD